MQIGQLLPDFTLPNQHCEPVRIYDILKRGPLILYFYPKDETIGCTMEACAFRDAIEEFRDFPASVVGISSDSPENHRRFAERHRLPFTLLSDRYGEIRRLLRVPNSLFGLIPGRVTYLVDSEGIVRGVYDSQINATGHVRAALAALNRLRQNP